ncbi:PKD domain-containing protein [Mucilaginibacter sp. ZT4R22]|uniref:PKD domain-containing protein n=1 Tax=Mucilaginibacter pankratovii TaxID=2772110 RepID=A0ABR7WNA3_9SPHI|nr:PKD domain-containing protein [Mucilaginibacter pankratovii]MBD1363808.1 PKD domain-containing protein [Mucilaginibacter pankratovii]
MYKAIAASIFSFFFLFILNANAQVTVNNLTGAGYAQIPVYTLSSGQVGVPVALAYSTTGVRPKDVEGTAGIGWNVQAGGQITRQLRSIPDDVVYDNGTGGTTQYGWMNYTWGTLISGFSPANDNNFATCPDEATDISYINTNLPSNNVDKEPDIFNVSAPGLSCQLVYDKASSQFKLISYQDLIISYTTVGGAGHDATLIASFTITNDRGIKYVFGAPESVTQKTLPTDYGSHAFFTTKYNNFINGITYNSSWQLTSITDPNGNGVQLNYTAVPVRNSTDKIILYLSGSDTQKLQYLVQRAVTSQELSSINTFNVTTTTTGLTFTRTTVNSGQTIITGISGLGHSYQLNYSTVNSTPGGYYRSFLRSFTEPGCSTPIKYTFTYGGETLSSGNYTTALPDSTTKKLDYWGYFTNTTSSTLIPKVWVNPFNSGYPRYSIYNPATSAGGYVYSTTLGNNRTPVSPSAGVSVGCLATITNVMGGVTSMEYEPNTYYDLPSGQSVIGGGLRVKSITNNDGINTVNNIVTSYTYLNSSGATSGKPISLPAYAFTLPSTSSLTGQSLWDYITVLSETDLSEEDHTIMYTDVRVYKTNAGSTLYSYYVPATYWDLSSSAICTGCSTTEWAPTTAYTARNSCTTANWNVKNDMWAYPFAPNANFDFERGLLGGVTTFNGAGAVVSTVYYSYTRSYTPTAIWAYKEDDMAFGSLSVKAYSKYPVYFNTSELVAQEVSKNYDSPTVFQTNTTNYTYGTNHKLLKQKQSTNSDGSVVATNYTYVKDYTTSASGSNAYVNALYNLKQPSLNMNLPVETYQTVAKGGTTVVTGGSLSLYSAFTLGSNTRYLPVRQMQLVQPDGLALASFTPYAIVGTTPQSSTPDNHYFTTLNITKYDNYGTPVTMDDANKRMNTTITDHFSGSPVAAFSNAKAGEVAFSDFDSDPSSPPPTAFTVSGSGAFTAVGSHAGNAYGLPAATKTFTSPTITKNTSTSTYILSLWLNSASGPQILNVSLNGGGAVGRSYTGTGGWQYVEFKVDVAAMPSTFTISFTSPTINITVDDILFYPDVAEVSTVTYDPVYHYKVAQTNTNGISSYFNNDQWGRVLFAMDQDKNIVQKNTYFTPADIQSFTSSVISTSGSFISGSPVSFSVFPGTACTAGGVTVDWTFGDGTSATGTTGLISPNHTYASAGTYYVNATVHSPLLGDVILPQITVTVYPGTVALSYASYTFGNGDITTVLFKIGSTIMYSFTGAQLNTAVVNQGNYTIVVQLSGGTHYNSGTGLGYNSVSLEGSCISACSSWVSNNTYTYSANITSCTALSFTVSQFGCD